jgi:hypothetical protein
MTFAGYAVGFKIQNLLSHHDLYIFLGLITILHNFIPRSIDFNGDDQQHSLGLRSGL